MITQQQIETKKDLALKGLRKQIELSPNKIVSTTFDIGGTHVCFMSQNKAKSSKWAQLARDGHEVIQVIITKENNISAWRYWGVIIDGELTSYRNYNLKQKETIKS